MNEQAELMRRVEFAKKRIRFFLENGSGNPSIWTLLGWMERQSDVLTGRPIPAEIVSKAMAEMQSASQIRIDLDRRAWLITDHAQPTTHADDKQEAAT